eukprot:Hpha_TRINITY_DN14449_c0_g1::TRINITY_DN14449_c0_g1_i1::g.157919::m.157919
MARPHTAEPPGAGRSPSPGRPSTALQPLKVIYFTEDELEKHLEKLYRAPVERRKKKREADAKEIAENRERNQVKIRPNSTGPSARDQRAAKKLYTEATKRQSDNARRLEQKFDQSLSWKKRQLHQAKMADTEVAELVERLFRASIERKQKGLAQAEKKFYPLAEEKVLTKRQALEAAQRMCDGAMQKKDDAMRKAEEQYGWHPDEPKRVDIKNPDVIDYFCKMASPKNAR